MLKFSLFEPVTAILRATADDITEPARRELGTLGVETKPDGSFVTKADRAAEARLTEQLTALLPGSKLLGEETVGNWRTSPLLTDRGDVWIADPIDGTSQFIRGEDYGIMLALRRELRIQAAWIYFPVTGDMLFASVDDATHHIVWAADGTVSMQRVSIPHRATGDMTLGYHPAERKGEWDLRGETGSLFAARRCMTCFATEVRQMVLAGTYVIDTTYYSPWDSEPTRLIAERAGAATDFHNVPLSEGPYRSVIAPHATARDVVLPVVNAAP